MAYYEVFLTPQSSDFNPNSPVKVQAETVEFFEDHGDYNFFSTTEGNDNEPVFVVPAHQVRYIQRFEDDEPDGPEALTVFQGQHKGSKSWGFWFFDDEQEICVFVPFEDRDRAERGLQRHKNGERNWGTWPLSETTPVKETIQ